MGNNQPTTVEKTPADDAAIRSTHPSRGRRGHADDAVRAAREAMGQKPESD